MRSWNERCHETDDAFDSHFLAGSKKDSIMILLPHMVMVVGLSKESKQMICLMHTMVGLKRME